MCSAVVPEMPVQSGQAHYFPSLSFKKLYQANTIQNNVSLVVLKTIACFHFLLPKKKKKKKKKAFKCRWATFAAFSEAHFALLHGDGYGLYQKGWHVGK
jgi:hypothetical protein